MRAGFELGRVGAGARGYQLDPVIETGQGEVGADGALGVVADDGDSAAGVAATGDDVVNVGVGLAVATAASSWPAISASTIAAMPVVMVAE